MKNINHILELNETLEIKDGVDYSIDNEYLQISNKEKCTELLSAAATNGWTQITIIDFFISLHIVLECGLHSWFRHVAYMGSVRRFDKLSMNEDLDRVGLIEKVVMFIYLSSFNTESSAELFKENSKIIGKLKNFCEYRNKLLHGHSIGYVVDSGITKTSKTFNQLNQDNVYKQIQLYREIMKGLRFFFDQLNCTFTVEGKEAMKKTYLDIDFLTEQA